MESVREVIREHLIEHGKSSAPYSVGLHYETLNALELFNTPGIDTNWFLKGYIGIYTIYRQGGLDHHVARQKAAAYMFRLAYLNK